MIDGTYNVSVNTPLGAQKGKVVLSTASGALKVRLSVGLTRQVFEGTVGANDKFVFSGAMDIMGKKHDFTCTGQVVGDALNAQIKSSGVALKVEGTRA